MNNNKGNSLTPIDPRTGKPGARIPVDDPYNLYFTPDGAARDRDGRAQSATSTSATPRPGG